MEACSSNHKIRDGGWYGVKRSCALRLLANGARMYASLTTGMLTRAETLKRSKGLKEQGYVRRIIEEAVAVSCDIPVADLGHPRGFDNGRIICRQVEAYYATNTSALSQYSHLLLSRDLGHSVMCVSGAKIGRKIGLQNMTVFGLKRRSCLCDPRDRFQSAENKEQMCALQSMLLIELYGRCVQVRFETEKGEER